MKLIDNVIILGLIVSAFIAGKAIADSYYRKVIAWLQYQLRVEAAEKGVGYVAPLEQEPLITEEFMEHLRKNGRATTLRTSRH